MFLCLSLDVARGAADDGAIPTKRAECDALRDVAEIERGGIGLGTASKRTYHQKLVPYFACLAELAALRLVAASDDPQGSCRALRALVDAVTSEVDAHQAIIETYAPLGVDSGQETKEALARLYNAKSRLAVARGSATRAGCD